MFDFTTKYLCGVFVDAQNAELQLHRLGPLVEQLGWSDAQTVPAYQSTPKGSRAASAIIQPGEDFIWQLVLNRTRFDLLAVPMSSSSEGAELRHFGNYGKFCAEASRLLTICLTHFGKKAYRLASVQEGVLPELKEDKLRKIRAKLLRLPSDFREIEPFEWDWKIAVSRNRKISRRDESCNELISVKRGRLNVAIGVSPTEMTEISELERIYVVLDVNTSPQNKAERFGGSEVKSFFKSVSTRHRELENMLGKIMGIKV